MQPVTLILMHESSSISIHLFIFIVNHEKYPKQEDSYAFEDYSSSESLSPEQAHSEESQGCAEPLTENKTTGSPLHTLTGPSQVRNRIVQQQMRHKMGLAIFFFFMSSLTGEDPEIRGTEINYKTFLLSLFWASI